MKEEINTLLEALTSSKNNNIVDALEKILNVILSDSSAALLSISGLPESDTKAALLNLFRPIAGLGMALSAVKNHLAATALPTSIINPTPEPGSGFPKDKSESADVSS